MAITNWARLCVDVLPSSTDLWTPQEKTAFGFPKAVCEAGSAALPGQCATGADQRQADQVKLAPDQSKAFSSVMLLIVPTTVTTGVKVAPAVVSWMKYTV